MVAGVAGVIFSSKPWRSNPLPITLFFKCLFVFSFPLLFFFVFSPPPPASKKAISVGEAGARRAGGRHPELRSFGRLGAHPKPILPLRGVMWVKWSKLMGSHFGR